MKLPDGSGRQRPDGRPADVRVSEWTGVRWPVYRMSIVAGVWDGEAGAHGPPPDHPSRRFMPKKWPPGGIFFPEAARVHSAALNVLLPVPIEGRHEYNPMAAAEDLFQAALAVDVTSAKELTTFVNRWGRLGVGLHWPSSPPARQGDHPPVEASESLLEVYRRETDSVEATAGALRQLQQFMNWLSAITNRQWEAEGIPTLDRVRVWAQGQLALCGVQESVPEAPSRHDYPRLHMLALGNWITQYLEGAHPTIRWDPDAGAVPAWIVKSPIEVLWVTLWDWATRGARIRRCRGCRVQFPAEHASKRFCSHECAARASAARWYRTKGKKLRQQLRDTRRGR